ncbi:MAG: oxygen-insensitive NAD(P)H nitroreductase [Zoogloeaceae bacterium]|jgi:nitroreductase/dihydropteridine reductase|nr:oxygen-insensitive NAD(P)H nitroreductase [Zoogloeaceae bacterium]
MNPAEIFLKRHSCKAFDSARRIPEEIVAQLKIALRNAPSSVNAQPWRFVLAKTDESRARIATSMPAPHFSGNAAKVMSASHALVLCAKKTLDSAYLETVLAAEDAAGRFPKAEHREAQGKGRAFYVQMHQTANDEAEWLARQVYIALGVLLTSAAALGVDACPMEGFDRAQLDAALGLTEKGYAALAVVALGYAGPDDFNAALPKSRLPESSVFTEI